MLAGESPLVEGDYYDGAFGATILLVLNTRIAVSWLRNVFDDLARAPIGSTFSLLDQPRVNVGAALQGLAMVRVDRPPTRHLVREPDGSFTWSCTADEWETASLMLEPLLSQAGHQYLTSEGIDDAIVEVSYGEDHG